MMEISTKQVWNNTQEDQLIKAINSASMVSISDPKGIIIYVNKKFCEGSGYTEQELLGRNHSVLKSGIHSERFFKSMWKSISSNRMWRNEVCNKRKNGSLYWVNTTIVPFTNEQGIIEKYVSIRYDITTNKKNIEELKSLKNKFSNIFNSANDAIYIIDKDTKKIVNINKKATALLGYTKAEFIGMPFFNLFSKENRPLIKENINHLISKHNIIFDTQLKHKNGSIIDVEVSSKLFNDGTQEVFQNIVRNITARKKTESKLKEIQYNNNLIIENTPYCIHRLDIKGNFLSMNSTGLKMMGLTEEQEIIGKNYVDLFSGDQKIRIQNLFNKAVMGEGSEFEFRTRKGQIWSSSFIPIKNGNKEIKLMGITLDISEQKEKEKLIISSKKRFKLIFDSAPYAYFICSPEGKILRCNSATELITGYKKTNLVKKIISDLDFLSKKNRDFFTAILKKPSKEPRKFEFKLTSKQGKKIDIELITHHVVIGGESLTLNIAHDITNKNATLKKLEQKTKDLELYLYRSSHDLRAPFTSLEGLLSLMKEEDIPKSTQELLEMFETTLNSGKVLIDNLTASSEMLNKSKKHQLIDFDKSLRKTLLNLKHLEGFNSINFIVKVPKSFKFYSNPQMLNSILQNLLQNAIKYKRPISKNHTPTIRINALKIKDDIKISIQDNGIGINEFELDKVFNLYYRSHSTINGTGLGLYITKNAVEYLNGSISVHSIVNKETIFDIVLPNIS